MLGVGLQREEEPLAVSVDGKPWVAPAPGNIEKMCASANLDTAGERIATAENTGLYYYENFTSSVVTKTGYILPARDA